MQNRVVIFFLGLCLSIDGNAAETCGMAAAGFGDLKKIAAQCETKIDCEKKANQVASEKRFAEDVQRAMKDGENVAFSSATPTSRTGRSMTYRLNSQKLKPKQVIYLRVPADIEAAGLEFVVLKHRQNPTTTSPVADAKAHDDVPGLTSVQILDRTRASKEQWRYWNGSASGDKGSKFAEVSHAFEIENLYQWMKLGHGSVNGDKVLHDRLSPSIVRLVNTGTDEVEIDEVTVKARFGKVSESPASTFVDGTAFGDLASENGYAIGGGQQAKGRFPGALELGGGKAAPAKLPSGWTFENGVVRIPLPKGKKFRGFEAAVGDSHPDGVINSDGGYGTKGWAKLSAEIESGGSIKETLMSRENVPPEGFLSGGPQRCEYVTTEGDTLVLRSHSDTTYLSGLRLLFD
jgi:hypothetical protein